MSTPKYFVAGGLLNPTGLLYIYMIIYVGMWFGGIP